MRKKAKNRLLTSFTDRSLRLEKDYKFQKYDALVESCEFDIN